MSLWDKIKKWIIIEAVERLSWALMAYVAGILLFSFCKINAFLLVGILSACALLFWFFRQKAVLSWLCLLSFCFFLGLGNITFQRYMARHFILNRPLYQTHISAVVEDNQLLIDKQILTLRDIYWPNPDLKMPQKIKVHFKSLEPTLKKGDKIKGFVSVYPPDETFSPAYTYQLWFNKIGATGIATAIEVTASSPDSSFLFEMRHFINKHLFQILPYSQAEVAAPLITGEQKLISKDTYQIYRRAGIAHVLSVSGFHMALLAGFLFFVIRSFCALFPRIVLFYNSKKIAAIIASVGTFLYLGLSGFQVPAIRAFAMIALVFLGVLVERTVLSMRSLMLICFGLLLMMPQMLFSISFQLSFMAVAVLVFICQYLESQPWNHFVKTLVGFVMLNVFVFLALMPFILYHFHQLMPYGILGNMLFSGAFSFFIMPLLFVGSLLIPFNLDAPVFYLAGWGLNIVHLGAEKLANFPYAEITVSDFSSLALILFAFGIILICLMKTPLRWLGSIFVVVGILLGILT